MHTRGAAANTRRRGPSPYSCFQPGPAGSCEARSRRAANDGGACGAFGPSSGVTQNFRTGRAGAAHRRTETADPGRALRWGHRHPTWSCGDSPLSSVLISTIPEPSRTHLPCSQGLQVRREGLYLRIASRARQTGHTQPITGRPVAVLGQRDHVQRAGETQSERDRVTGLGAWGQQ